MNKPLYQIIATLVEQHENCMSPRANESQRSWAPRTRARLKGLVQAHMPSGSGLDTGTVLFLDASTPNRLVFRADFHHMDENGHYDGWTEHEIHVTPSLAHGFAVRITGRNRNDVKELLHETFHQALSAEYPQDVAS